MTAPGVAMPVPDLSDPTLEALDTILHPAA